MAENKSTQATKVVVKPKDQQDGGRVRNCSICNQRRAALKRPKTLEQICRECFYEVFEEEIHKVIVNNQLFKPGERIAKTIFADSLVVSGSLYISRRMMDSKPSQKEELSVQVPKPLTLALFYDTDMLRIIKGSLQNKSSIQSKGDANHSWAQIHLHSGGKEGTDECSKYRTEECSRNLRSQHMIFIARRGLSWDKKCSD